MEVLQDEERSILFSSHNTLDVEQISDQITFIDRGRIVDSDDKEAFLERWRRLSLEVPRQPSCRRSRASSTSRAAGTPPSSPPTPSTRSCAAAYRQAGATVREVQRMTLEEIFVATVMHKRKERGE